MCRRTTRSLPATTGIEHLAHAAGQPAALRRAALQREHRHRQLQLLSQAFPTGTSFSVEVDNNRQTSNSIFNSLNPTLNSYYRITLQQQLLSGFGTGPNLRFLRIAKNNKKISDIAFKMQIVATITQVANIYWDLVSAYEEEKVNEQSYAFAKQSFENAQKQLQLEAIPAMDVMRAEAEVSRRDQDLTVAKTNLQLQESLIKNALTKNLDDPTLEAMPVIPTDLLDDRAKSFPSSSTQELICAGANRSAGAVASRNSTCATARSRAKLLPMRCCRRWRWLASTAAPDWPAI